MRPLVIDNAAKERIAQLLEFAKNNIYRPGKSENPPGNDARHVVEIFMGFRAVFSFTLFPLPEGPEVLYRHLTISIDGPSYPNPIAAFMLADAFGFTGWKIEMGEQPGTGWMGDVCAEDHCITILQKV